MTPPNIRNWYRRYGMLLFATQHALNLLMGTGLRMVHPQLQREADMLAALEHASRLQRGHIYQECYKGLAHQVEVQLQMRSGTGVVWERKP